MYVQMHDQDAVAYIGAGYRVVVDSCCGEMALDGACAAVDVEAQGVALTDGIVQVCGRNQSELHEQVIYTVAAVVGNQRINDMESRVGFRDIEFAPVTRVPNMIMRLVSGRTDIYRVAEVVH